MLNEFLRGLVSGSDIRGNAVKTKNNEIDLSNEVIEKIALAFAKWLSLKNAVKLKMLSVAVGHDSRISASRIKSVVINALTSVGVQVFDCSMASTPAMFMAISVFDADGAIEITASHHPFEKNGMKFFTSKGGLNPYDIENILEIAEAGDFPDIAQKGKVRSVNIMDYYSERICEIIRKGINCETNYNKPLTNLKIVVDAGNGVGGFFVNNILRALGAKTSGSVFLEPDGNFPNHVPNPENAEAMESIKKAVLKAKADLGIIFDTDVDRMAIVDLKGVQINKNKLIALASAIVLNDQKNAIIVTDSVTSDNLKKFINSLDGTLFRHKRGYNNVIEMAKKLNKFGKNCPLAIETSGHAALRENKFIDDGAYLAAKIIIEFVKLKNLNKTFEDLLLGYKDSLEVKEIRIPLSNCQNAATNCKKLFETLENYAKTIKNCEVDSDNIEGIRMNFENGWCLLRKSVHDPLLVLNVESNVKNGVKKIISKILPALRDFDFINFSEIA